MRIKAMVNDKCMDQFMRGTFCYIIGFDNGNPICAFAYDKWDNKSGTYKPYAYIRTMYTPYITIIDPNYIVDKSFDEQNNDDIQPR